MNLQIKNLSVSYDTEAVLENLSLTVEDGEFLSLLGPSGCGKSTLLKSIAGILTPNRGEIFLGNQNITHMSVHKRGTVVLFQDMRLFPHLSVAENVAFPLKMQGISRKERLTAAGELLKKVQMDAFASRLPGELSGGQQQRVALARALAAKPKLLLLDEPFSALDENLREEMRRLVLMLHKEFGMTTILVTHDREEALSMSHRVAMMFGGKIHQLDTPEAVYRHPATRQTAAYFGDCLYLRGTVADRCFSSSGVRIPAELPDGTYDLLLRPGDFQLDEAGEYPAVLESKLYRGSDTLALFRGDDGLLWKKVCPEDVSLTIGDRVRGRIRPKYPVLFPTEAPQPNRQP